MIGPGAVSRSLCVQNRVVSTRVGRTREGRAGCSGRATADGADPLPSVGVRSMCDRCGIDAESMRNRCGIDAESMRNRCGPRAVDPQSIHGQRAVVARRACGRCAGDTRSMCGRCAVDGESMCARPVLDAGSACGRIEAEDDGNLPAHRRLRRRSGSVATLNARRDGRRRDTLAGDRRVPASPSGRRRAVPDPLQARVRRVDGGRIAARTSDGCSSVVGLGAGRAGPVRLEVAIMEGVFVATVLADAPIFDRGLRCRAVRGPRLDDTRASVRSSADRIDRAAMVRRRGTGRSVRRRAARRSTSTEKGRH